MRGKVEICGIDTSKLQVLKNDEMMETKSSSGTDGRASLIS